MIIENTLLLLALLTPLLLAAAIADLSVWREERKARRLPRARVTWL